MRKKNNLIKTKLEIGDTIFYIGADGKIVEDKVKYIYIEVADGVKSKLYRCEKFRFYEEDINSEIFLSKKHLRKEKRNFRRRIIDKLSTRRRNEKKTFNTKRNNGSV